MRVLWRKISLEGGEGSQLLHNPRRGQGVGRFTWRYGMLVLGRRLGESVLIGNQVRVTIVRIESGGQVKLAFEAPRHVRIMRTELLERTPHGNGDREAGV